MLYQFELKVAENKLHNINIMNWIPTFAGMTFRSYRQLINRIGINYSQRVRTELCDLMNRIFLRIAAKAVSLYEIVQIRNFSRH